MTNTEKQKVIAIGNTILTSVCDCFSECENCKYREYCNRDDELTLDDVLYLAKSMIIEKVVGKNER